MFAEIVGEKGRVYAHNTPGGLARRKGVNPVQERIDEAKLTNVETIVTEPAALNLPPNLDVVLMSMTYHDMVWSGVDRPAMNKSIYAGLKSGGIFAVLDHHARPGRGIDDCHEHHRIEKSSVIHEVTAAGFKLVGESNVLENDEDTRDAGPFQKGKRDHTSRFLLKFQKP